MPNMCIAFLCQCLSLDFFFSTPLFTTTLPLTSSYLISLAVHFLCVSRFSFCVLSGAVYVYVYVYLCVCVYVCVFVCVVVVLVVVVVDTYKAKSGETLVEASRDTNAQIVRYTWRRERKTNRTRSIADSFRSVPQENWS